MMSRTFKKIATVRSVCGRLVASTKGGSQNAISKLTFQSDHSVGAGHPSDATRRLPGARRRAGEDLPSSQAYPSDFRGGSRSGLNSQRPPIDAHGE